MNICNKKIFKLNIKGPEFGHIYYSENSRHDERGVHQWWKEWIKEIICEE